MEMTYALNMPSSYLDLTEDEMVYLEGGTKTTYGTAKTLKGSASTQMAAWGALAGGYSYTTAAAAASGVGMTVAWIAGLGTAYCAFVANEFRGAYNYFSGKSQTAKTQYYLQVVTFVGGITGVNYGKK
ncbi:hypothetical protein P7H50_07420 [Enterococcus durans]|uniref:hypothetical protein n=1 Tax=Enterococcus TaxID=1350 RepID=UPI0028920890|nr:hypothetical protein [Enterococcus durans]MDT2836718.1 hypothetical protein [Enterococcus durans]